MATRPAVQLAGSKDTDSTPGTTLQRYLTLSAGYGNLLLACVHQHHGSGAVSSFEFGGTALTLAYNTVGTGCDPRVSLYYYIDPPTGSSTQLECIMDTTMGFGIGWVHLHWAKINGASPFSYTNYGTASGATAISIPAYSTGVDDLVIDFFTRCGEGGGYTDSPTGTQNYWNWTTEAVLSSRTHLGSQRKNGTGSSVTMNWTWGGNSGTWHSRVVSVAPYEFPVKHKIFAFF